MKLTFLVLRQNLKVDKLNDKAENECFYKMFSQSTNLAMMAITSEKVINKLSMYGTLVAVEKSYEARLLQLVMNFEENRCRFEEPAAPQLHSVVKMLFWNIMMYHMYTSKRVT